MKNQIWQRRRDGVLVRVEGRRLHDTVVEFTDLSTLTGYERDLKSFEALYRPTGL